MSPPRRKENVDQRAMFGRPPNQSREYGNDEPMPRFEQRDSQPERSNRDIRYQEAEKGQIQDKEDEVLKEKIYRDYQAGLLKKSRDQTRPEENKESDVMMSILQLLQQHSKMKSNDG